MLADRARSEPPARTEQQDLEDHHDDDDRHGDWHLAQENAQKPAHDRQIGELVRRLELGERARTVRRRFRDEVVQVAGQSDSDDVDDRAADDLIGSNADRQPGMKPRDQDARDERDDEGHDEGRVRAEWAEIGRSQDRCQQYASVPAHEGRREHDPFDPDVDDARALAHHAAQRSEGDRGRRLKDSRGDVRADRDDVAAQLEDQADERDRIQGVDEGVHYWTTASPLYVLVRVSVVSRPDLTPRRRKSRCSTGFATRNRRIVAWSTSISSLGMRARISMSVAPDRNAPNKRAAATIPSGFVRPRRATAMESNPTVVPNEGVIRWFTPRMTTAPANPARPP